MARKGAIIIHNELLFSNLGLKTCPGFGAFALVCATQTWACLWSYKTEFALQSVQRMMPIPKRWLARLHVLKCAHEAFAQHTARPGRAIHICGECSNKVVCQVLLSPSCLLYLSIRCACAGPQALVCVAYTVCKKRFAGFCCPAPSEHVGARGLCKTTLHPRQVFYEAQVPQCILQAQSNRDELACKWAQYIQRYTFD